MLCHSLIHSHSMHPFRMSIFVIVSFPIWNITSCTFLFFRWWCDFESSNWNGKRNHIHLHTLKECLYVSFVSESRTNSNDTFYFNFLFWHFSFSSCVCFNFILDFFPPSWRRLLMLLLLPPLSFHLCCVNRSRLSLQWHCVSLFPETKILIMESISQAKFSISIYNQSQSYGKRNVKWSQIQQLIWIRKNP